MNQQDNQQYRLHHLPFMVMWVASFGVAWLGIFFSSILVSDLRNNVEFVRMMTSWMDAHRWLYGLLIGAGFGAFLALVQPWLIRWRYGFVPRFWRIATFFGGILSGAIIFEYFFYSYGYSAYNLGDYLRQFAPIFVWFTALIFVQMVALWPVARRAWLYPLAGIGASAVAFLFGFWDSYGMAQMNVIFFGSFAQAVFSGGMFLWLMRDYRVEAVPKRDEKAKVLQRRGLHPMSFIGLWMMAHLFGWVALLSAFFILILLSSSFSFINSFMNWLGNAQWILAIGLGLIVGTVTSMAQAWLIDLQSSKRPRFWLPLSLIAWVLAGFSLWQFGTSTGLSYSSNGFWVGATLFAWFALPPFFQAFALHEQLGSAWLYALSGAVSGLIAYLVLQQFEWTSGEYIYAIIFGAIVQAILTGVAFLMMLQNQPKPVEETQAIPQEV